MKKIIHLTKSALMAGFFLIPTAAAEEIPEDMLLMDYANCMQGCLEVEGRTACEILCGCSVSRFRSELDLAAYDLLSRELVRNEISQENRAFLDETGQICVAEMDRLMEQFAQEAAPQDLLPPPGESGQEEEGGGS